MDGREHCFRPSYPCSEGLRAARMRRKDTGQLSFDMSVAEAAKPRSKRVRMPAPPQTDRRPPKKKPDEPCGGCGERAPIRRLVGTGGAVIFKGSGFYETDYRSESYKKGAEAEKKSTGDSGTGGAESKSGAEASKSDKSPGKPATGKKNTAGKGKK